jgi:hypothetical protein
MLDHLPHSMLLLEHILKYVLLAEEAALEL